MKHAATTQSHPSTLSKPSSGVHRYLLLPVLWYFTLVGLCFSVTLTCHLLCTFQERISSLVFLCLYPTELEK